jgi:hypothetical protein
MLLHTAGYGGRHCLQMARDLRPRGPVAVVQLPAEVFPRLGDEGENRLITPLLSFIYSSGCSSMRACGSSKRRAFANAVTSWPLLAAQKEQAVKKKGSGNLSAREAKPKRRRRNKGMCLEDRPVLEPNAAGIDVGAREMFVAVYSTCFLTIV